jgi:hypothetical protein
MARATKARLTRKFSARILALSPVIASILAALFLFLCDVHAASAGCDAGPQERATVVSVGDRLDFTLADARQVRLAGLDPADPDHGDPATAGAARAFAMAWLSGREVGLRLLSAKPDRWGRMLVFLAAACRCGRGGACLRCAFSSWRRPCQGVAGARGARLPGRTAPG